MSTEKRSVFMQLLEDGIEVVQRPFVTKRAKRSFESAKDSLEEKLINNEGEIAQARKNFVESVKSNSKSELIQSHIQTLINLRAERNDIVNAQKYLAEETAEFL
jgi:hypothetical protein